MPQFEDDFSPAERQQRGLSKNAHWVFKEIPGGSYIAEQDSEGRWSILDVPVFAELPAGIRHNEAAIGADWMRAVIEKHAQREREEKYLAPVHLNHHDEGRDTPRLGFLRPKRVGKIQVDGKDKDALFADIVGVEEQWLAKIRNLSAPYRSAEIPKDWRPEIASLALMGDEAPHFKLPLLTIGETRRRFKPGAEPAFEFAETDRRSLILFRFGEDMPKPIETTKNDPLKPELVTFTEAQSVQIKEIVAAALKEAAEKKEPEKKESAAQDDPTAGKTGNENIEPAMLKSEIAKAVGLETAKLAGEVSGLKAAMDLRTKSEETRSLAAAAKKDLETGGWHVSQDLEGRIEKFAALGKEVVDNFIGSHKASCPKDPPRTVEELEAGSGSSALEKQPAELVKYAAKGPKQLETALNYSKMFDELNGVHKLSTSREEFIDIQFDTERQRAEARTAQAV